MKSAGGLLAQAASAPTLGHQTLTPSPQGGVVISQMAKLRLLEIKAFGKDVGEQDWKPGCLTLWSCSGCGLAPTPPHTWPARR